MPGTSDAWLASHLCQKTSNSAYHIVDCRILGNRGLGIYCSKIYTVAAAYIADSKS